VGVPGDDPADGELAAYADGSLDPARRRRVELRLQEAPELRASLARQHKALAATGGLREQAPAGMTSGLAMPARPRVRRGLLPAGATIVVAGAVAAILVLSAGEPARLSVAEAAVTAARPATAPAPARAGRGRLALTVDGRRYPDWRRPYGWRAVGARRDVLRARPTVTVFYERAGHRLAYTIVSGPALPPPANGRVQRRAGVVLRLLPGPQGLLVTWRRQDRTCLLSGVGVAAETLLELAADR